MSDTTAAEFYHLGGGLRPDAPSYVERNADTQLYHALKRGEFCYILTTRQMGKTSLRNRVARRLHQEGCRIIHLDLTALGQNLTAEQWYNGLLYHVGVSSDLEDELEDFWEAHCHLGPALRWVRALTEVVLPRSSAPLIVFIDEIDAVLSLPFKADELFAAIRELYNRRVHHPDLNCLTFCLIGVAAPTDLIRDTRMTPFNIGVRIELTDFSPEEAAVLAQGLVPSPPTPLPDSSAAQTGRGETDTVLWSSPDAVPTAAEESNRPGGSTVTTSDGENRGNGRLPSPSALARESGRGVGGEGQRLLARILYWTNGHPYLTQRLCAVVAEAIENRKSKIENGLVDRLCRELFLTGGGRETEDNLKFVSNRLLRSEADVSSLLDLYSKVQSGKRVPDDETNPLADLLKLSGVARVVDGVLKVRNRIYERVFDKGWIQAHLPDAELQRQRAAYRRGRNRTLAIAGVVVAMMTGLAAFGFMQARRANQLTTLANERADAAEHTSYIANMNVIQSQWENNNGPRVVELLEETRNNKYRGFEWDYWNRLCHLDLMTLKGHTAVVNSVAYSPDKTRIVTGSEDKTAKVWDAQSGKELFTLKGHENFVFAVAFSPNSKYIVTGSRDKTAKVWNALNGRKLLTFKMHKDIVNSAAFSPDGKLIVTGSGDKTAKVWDAQTGKVLLTLEAHTSGVIDAAFSPDGKHIVTGSEDQSAKVWDAQTGKESLTLKGHSDMITSVAFSPEGKRIVTGSRDTTAKVWDSATGQEKLTLKGHIFWITSVAFSPDSKRIVTGSHDATARVWDAQTGQETYILKGHTTFVHSVTFSSDGKRIVTGSHDATAKVWEAQEDRETRTLKDHPYWVTSVAFSPDSKSIVTVSGNLTLTSRGNTVKVWDVATGEERLTLPEQTGVVSVAFSHDGKRIVTGGRDKMARVWDAQTGQKLLTLTGHELGIWAVAFSPDGKRIVTGSGDAFNPNFNPEWLGKFTTAKVWDAQTGRELLTLKGHQGDVTSVAFSSDGERIVTGGMFERVSNSKDRIAKVWDAETGKELHTLKGHTDWVSSVAFSPDGKQIVTGSGDYTAKVWDAATGKEKITLKGQAADVRSVAFSPDGKRIVTGSADKTAKVWDAQTGKETLTLKGHTDAIMCVAFSPDGKRILTGSSDRTAKVWFPE